MRSDSTGPGTREADRFDVESYPEDQPVRLWYGYPNLKASRCSVCTLGHMKHVVTSAAFVTIGALGIAACGGVSTESFRESLVSEGANDDAAQCVVDYLEDNLSESDFEVAMMATGPDGISQEMLPVLLEAFTDCDAF